MAAIPACTQPPAARLEQKKSALCEMLRAGGRAEVYNRIMKLGSSVRPLQKGEGERVTGCLSETYLGATVDTAGRVIIRGRSDALLSKGLLGILVHLYDSEPLSPDLLRSLSSPSALPSVLGSAGVSVARMAGFAGMSAHLHKQLLRHLVMPHSHRDAQCT
eukprot:Sspe_Gene.40109::Locus_19344_Transcript_1_1_Confidence_1.000_Length_2813::g.40109::m.40109/K02426/sufE; cysteine desulfuration protein SufE